jgi:hypothetical protein
MDPTLRLSPKRLAGNSQSSAKEPWEDERALSGKW